MRRATFPPPVLALLAALLVATPAPAHSADTGSAERADPTDWSPAPTTVGGLQVLATADEDGFVLRTEGGERTFLPGVNLGSSVPLHQPGEIAVLQAADYRRWFEQMGDLGIRVVRTYTIHPPAFFDELAAYAERHPDAPLYLVQGAYFPDESYVDAPGTLLDAVVDDPFRQELLDVSGAVHGDLARPARPGAAGGTWTTDVSHLLAGWVVGVELDPVGVQRTDALPLLPLLRGTTGRFFRATPQATTTERWLADHLDALAAAEAARGTAAPIAFVNWSPTDPLSHPTETTFVNDLVGVDANHVLPTDAWPAGSFASYHAYPYYPDFLRDEPGLWTATWAGRPDPYAGYLAALRDHHEAAGLPLLVTELGVPSSLGNAHLGPLGRDQGGHTEQEAMRIDAELLRIAHAEGAGGAFLFSWTDEWFKRTWNTMAHQDPERRQLWHDPLTNEQHFGLVATDPGPVEDAGVEVSPRRGPVSYAYVRADAAWVHVDLALRRGLPRSLRIDADSLAEVPGPDQRVLARLAGTGRPSVRVQVRRELDPVRLDTSEPAYVPDHLDAWHPFRLLMNRALPGRAAEHQEVGVLRRGSWDPAHPSYDSTATWQATTNRRTGAASVRLRLPWSVLGYADPSARRVLGPGPVPRFVEVPGLDLSVVVDGAAPVRVPLRWPGWNRVGWTERPKAGIGVVAEAFRDLAG